MDRTGTDAADARRAALTGGAGVPDLERRGTVEDMFDLAAPSLRTVFARLLNTSGSLPSIEVCTEEPLLRLGRGRELPEATRFECSRLSTFHCELRVEPATLVVTLVDTSTNGTFINGARMVKGKPTELKQGDSIALLNPAVGGEEQKRHEFLFQRIKEATTAKALTEELTCGICQSVFYKPVSLLPCLHTFCAHCASQWIESSRACPECKGAITEVRPSHKLQSVVDNFLKTQPKLRLSAEEMAEADRHNRIPPTGKVLGGGVKRPRAAYDDEDEDEDEDEDGSDGDDDDHVHHHGGGFGFGHRGGGFGGWVGGRGFGMAAPPGYVAHLMPAAFRPAAPAVVCAQCTVPAVADGFQCPPGGRHLGCFACKTPFPDRPLHAVAQKCEMCNVPFCDLYLGGCKSPAGVKYLLPVRDHEFDCLPVGSLFAGNNVEIGILQGYMERAGIAVPAAWRECLDKFAAGTWKPDMTTVRGEVTTATVACKPCAMRVFSALLFHFRRAVPRDALPGSIAARGDCWFGQQCRTQHKNPAHAQNYNHVCLADKRKE